MVKEGGQANTGQTTLAQSKKPSGPYMGYRIEERDVLLLQDLYNFSLLSRDQILQLGYFGSISRLNRRLRILRSHRYISFNVPPYARHGTQFLYGLDREGIRLVAHKRGLDVTEVRRHCRADESPITWEHTIAIGDFWIALTEAIKRREDIRIERWLPERDARMEFDVRERNTFRTCVVRPDAFVRLKFEGSLLPAFLEIDKGHVSKANWQSKANSFDTLLASGLFAEDFGQDRFAVLVVTTCHVRMHNLLTTVRDNTVPYLGCTFADIREDALGEIWHSASGAGPVDLPNGIARAIGGSQPSRI